MSILSNFQPPKLIVWGGGQIGLALSNGMVEIDRGIGLPKIFFRMVGSVGLVRSKCVIGPWQNRSEIVQFVDWTAAVKCVAPNSPCFIKLFLIVLNCTTGQRAVKFVEFVALSRAVKILKRVMHGVYDVPANSLILIMLIFVAGLPGAWWRTEAHLAPD